VGEPPPRIVVAHPDRKAQRALVRMLGASGLAVGTVEPDALADATLPDAIFVVDADVARARPELRARPGRAWIAVPGEGQAPADPAAVDALLVAGWTHIVAHAMPILAEELLATVQKLARRDVFGLDKYVVWAATMKSYALADTGDRDAVVAALAKDVVQLGLPDRVASLVSVAADELIANALYAAPIDERGVHFRADEPRDRRRALSGREVVAVRLATDARYLAIEVRDRWGTLDPGAIAPRLGTKAQAVDNGMGLPLVYACCNQLAIAVAPQVATETIALVDVRYKPTELGRSASFHVFTGELR
jgi:hypothetical protein